MSAEAMSLINLISKNKIEGKLWAVAIQVLHFLAYSLYVFVTFVTGDHTAQSVPQLPPLIYKAVDWMVFRLNVRDWVIGWLDHSDETWNKAGVLPHC